MSEKKKKEVISNLDRTIEIEKSKFGGGNSETIKKLEGIKESVIDGTYVSQFKKRAKRKPKKKKK
tara:strand:- start:217 stop:411 length:195 start_codon:yes stop_codon:yes gene_type:complete